MPGENLTRVEAQERKSIVDVHSYAISLDLTRGEEVFGSTTTVKFTATEGAIAACVWSLFLGVVWYRTMKLKKLVKVSMDTIETTAAVLFIVAAASIFGWMLTATGVTAAISGEA